MSDEGLRDLIAESRLASLATIKKDGRPQLSNVIYVYHRKHDVIHVSVTAGRAKTHNLQRDPRASLLVNGNDGWKYTAADVDAELGPVCVDPHDESTEALVKLYRTLQGEHDDWEEFRAAMVSERRQPLTLRITHLYGTA